jgi:predicted short-subunit dehydrogenase-like oxidoreductase (DUF2520 family)
MWVPSSVERVSSPSFWVREERRSACHLCPIIANPFLPCLLELFTIAVHAKRVDKRLNSDYSIT